MNITRFAELRARVTLVISRRVLPSFLGLFAASCADQGVSTPSTSIVEAGWSFGFCIGPCRGTLEVTGDAVTLRVTDRTGNQTLAGNAARLTGRGSARLAGAAAALPKDMEERYGCPDCADGGASFILVLRQGAARRTEYEYGNPPSELAEADAVLADLIQALRECRQSSDLTIEPGCVPVSS
jgi:hypothetical protein